MDLPKTLGAYAVEREVGRGGMGVVYQGHDPRLNRMVAVKVLSAAVAEDPDHLARFEREARLLASLNHPNIGSIYGLETAEDGTRFLVLEFLDGPTLQDRLLRGPLGIEEAIDIFRQIAEALESAHESGIIHRDLKPSNIKLTPDGGVKVLDFGLAKYTAPDTDAGASNSSTVTAQTQAGAILGTAAYMSPEQARGKPLDRRTDIFSFGCVFYEALTGRPLFAGESVSDTIAHILEREPDWTTLSDIPERVRRIIQRCLEKDVRRRQRDIGDVRLGLEEIQEARVSSSRAVRESGEHRSAASASRRSAALAWGVAAIAIAAAVTSFVVPGWRRTEAPGELIQFIVTPPPGGTMYGNTDAIKLSPDGTHLLFAGLDETGGILVRSLSSPESRLLPQTQTDGSVFWAPDGQSVGFFGDDKLRTLSLRGGESRPVCDATSDRGATWGAEYIVFAGAQGPLYKVPVNGGTPVPVTRLNEERGETAHRYPHFLPDGKTFLYVALPGKSRLLDVYAGHVDGRDGVRVTSALTSPVYAEPGYLIFQRGRQLVAQAFDPRKLATSGDLIALGPAPRLYEGVGACAASVSRTGHLAFLTPEDPRARLVWADPTTGRELEVLDVEPAVYRGPAFSPDGRHLALEIEVSPEESDIWILEMDRLVMTRFTQGFGRSGDPKWSPDGAYLAYATNADGPENIFKKPFTRGGPPEPLVVGPAPFKTPMDWSPDGKYLLYEQLGEGTNMDLWLAPTDGSGEPRPYLAEVVTERAGRFSPDGRWVVYVTQEAGKSNVYVRSFPVPGQPHRVSIDYGTVPSWASDGKSILFSGRGQIVRASFQAGPSLRIGIPEPLYTAPEVLGGAVAPDGRILSIRSLSPPRGNTATVVLNWTHLLESATSTAVGQSRR